MPKKLHLTPEERQARKAAKAAYMKAWRAANAAHIQDYNHTYHTEHAAHLNAKGTIYRAEHKEELYEKKKVYNAANPEKVKAWEQAKRDRINADPLKREAHLIYGRTYHQAHQDTANAGRRARRLTNLVAERAKDKARNISRKDWTHAYNQAYRETHRDALATKRAANKEQIAIWQKAWQAANKDRMVVLRQRRLTRQAGLPATFTAADAAFMRQYFHYACAACDREEGFEWVIAMDHWIPLSSPLCPGTVPTNMIPLCHGDGGCNNTKHNTDPLVWLQRRFGPRKAAAIRRKIEAYFALLRERG